MTDTTTATFIINLLCLVTLAALVYGMALAVRMMRINREIDDLRKERSVTDD